MGLARRLRPGATAPGGEWRFGLRRSHSGYVNGVALGLGIAALTATPILYVIVSSFDVAGIGDAYRFGTGSWYEIFSNDKTWESIVYSFILAVRVPLATVVGFCIAWLIVRAAIPGHRIFELAFWFTFLMPSLPLLLGWVLLLNPNNGLINQLLKTLPFIDGAVFSIYTMGGIIWAHMVMTTVPIMVILLTASMRQLDSAYEEAAEMSGAGLFTRWKGVTVPLVFPAIATAFILSLIRSLEAFEVERVIGTPVGINVYSTRIFDYIAQEPPLLPQAMALSCLFLVVLLTLAFFYQRYLDRAGDRAVLTGRGVRTQNTQRARWHYVASAALWIYLAVVLVVPLGILLLGSLTKLFGFFLLDDPWTTAHWQAVFDSGRFYHSVGVSVVFGLVVGVLGTLLYSLVAWILVRTRIAGRTTVSIMIWLPWAIPGVVLGVALLSVILNTPGLSLLYGTMIPLILAMIIKELPVGVQLLRTAVGQVSGQLEEAAVIAGAGFSMVFRRITLPLIAPVLVSVFLLSFAATLRDISTVVLIATPGTQTMSLLMFEFAITGELESSAVMGVIIALVAIVLTAISLKIGRGVGVRG